MPAASQKRGERVRQPVGAVDRLPSQSWEHWCVGIVGQGLVAQPIEEIRVQPEHSFRLRLALTPNRHCGTAGLGSSRLGVRSF